MTTRNEVETAINTIEDNGNNTAAEVRVVLTKLLNYTENEESDSDVKLFHFNNKGESVKSGIRASLLYSFKGIVGHTVNFTFKLLAAADNNGNFSFPLEAELIPVLLKIMQTHNITFIVPLLRLEMPGPANIRPSISGVPLMLSFKDPNLLIMNFPKLKMLKGDSILTSLQFHLPENFNLD